ncbi:hypothetical protein VP06_05420 [Methylobacterium aquaticum]|uniref:Uncharacterized protein n=1 Tax=Methylobacterium aquaticum TaxID=270351 RepID=A0A0J6VIH7_9HYPH|nr:hypothetical protein [Methylobacterium aquaticum]KMO38911.1 hypothetical protein VP06_05420 [Methylobacterium aquaticum]
MAKPFFERPILNSPYEAPTQHHALDEEGRPLDLPPIQGRRRSELITPAVPKPKKQTGKGKQDDMPLGDASDLSSPEQAYTTGRLINEIRSHVASWRGLPNPADWGVTPRRPSGCSSTGAATATGTARGRSSAKQTCVGRPTLRLLRVLFDRRFLPPNRRPLRRNLL